MKQIHSTPLETPHSLQLAPWPAGYLAEVPEEGFRFAGPLASRDGSWMLSC